MPKVTMVFTIADGSKGLARRLPREVGETSILLRELMMDALRHVPGGYFCREQPGDLKYMVVFATPKVCPVQLISNVR
jgi:hypothetical protein